MAAIDRELLMTLTEALAALVQRVGAVEGIARIPGPQGEQGPKGDQGDAAPPVTADEVRAQLDALIAENPAAFVGPAGQDGKAGRAPTAAEIELAVELWMAFNADQVRGPAGRDGRDGRDGADGIGRDGRNGRDGNDGRNGTDGVGIALIEQRGENSFWITLTDGREFEIELPVSKRTTVIGGGGSGGSGGGIVEIVAGEGIAVDNTDPARPIVSATGSADSRQEVFIGAPAILPTYPALIFTERTIDGQTVYEMQVNVP